jgi:GT2 family glycosyltransferase
MTARAVRREGETTDVEPEPTPEGVTLIVCSRNRPGLLSSVVASILDGTEVPDELLIVDQSLEPHPELRTFTTPRCAFRYLQSATVGLSRGRNIGIAAASHPVIVFTDDDVLVPPEWFGTIVRSLHAAGKRVVVTGRVLAAEAEIEGGFAPSLHPGTEPVTYEGRVRQDPLATFNMAMHRSAHAEVGGFDVRLGPGTPFPAAEDNDFGHRLLESGYRIVFDPEAVVYHRAWRNDHAYAALRHGYGRGQGAFYAKHLSFEDRYMLRRMIGTLANHIRRLPRAAVNDLRAAAGNPPPAYWRSAHRSSTSRRLAAGEIAWILGFFAGTFEWLTTKRRLR